MIVINGFVVWLWTPWMTWLGKDSAEVNNTWFPEIWIRLDAIRGIFCQLEFPFCARFFFTEESHKALLHSYTNTLPPLCIACQASLGLWILTHNCFDSILEPVVLPSDGQFVIWYQNASLELGQKKLVLGMCCLDKSKGSFSV